MAKKTKNKTDEVVVPGFKGFDKDFKCRGFQFEENKEYEHVGKVETCRSGFHSCEHPFDVFIYYPPGTNTYAETESSGTITDHDEDSKIASSKIRIKAKLPLHEFIQLGVNAIFERVEKTKRKHNDEPRKLASNSDYGGAASNSGDRGAASNSGNGGAAFTNGHLSKAETSGKETIAAALGIKNVAKATLGNWIILAEWKETTDGWVIETIERAKVDGKKIKADVFYKLEKGKFIEA